MGAIALSEHIQLRQKVVLKFLLPSFATEVGSVERFIREAKHAAQVKSARAVRVLDVSSTVDGTPYIVMEYLQGADLAAELTRRGTIPIEEAVDLVLATCEAIAVAHKLGIVHRDLKPANLFLVRDGDSEPGLKVLDFGIAKSMNPENASLAGNTETHSMLGTPAYMSPEQLRSAKNVDGRTDIWALGVVLYELISGERPFAGASPAEVCAGIFRDPPVPIRKKRPDVPPKLAQAIERCLEKDREARYPSIVAFASALAPYAGARGKASLRAIEEAVGKSTELAAHDPKKKRAFLLLVPAVILLSGAGFLVMHARDPRAGDEQRIETEKPASESAPRDIAKVPPPESSAHEAALPPVSASALPAAPLVSAARGDKRLTHAGHAVRPKESASKEGTVVAPPKEGDLFGTSR